MQRFATMFSVVSLLAAATSVACAQEQKATPQAAGPEAAHCTPQRATTAGRPSPYDSVLVTLGNGAARICYGRPSARGRTMIGGDNVPYGKLWRTGANEPTILHLPFAARIAGIAVAPGSYSLYTIPTEGDWTVIVNRSISQWGHESRYTPEVQAQEVGRASVASTRLEQHIETFTIRAEPAGDGVHLILEWEHTRVTIPIVRAG